MPTVMNGVSLNALTTVDTWSALSLFANGEQGAWYDPSDMSTMFQDAAGTIPVTAVEQPVGLILDKSKGLALGSELVTNGDFSSGTTGWTASNVTPSVSGGELTLTNVGSVYGTFGQSFTTVAGRWYKATVDVRVGTASFAFFAARTSLFGGTIASAFTSSSTTVRLTIHFAATGTTTWISIINDSQNNATAFYDNISVRELPGNHASQSTSASRPVLSARVNLLTYSEQFDNAVWNKLNSGTGVLPVVTANYAAVAPNGSQTADRIQFDLGATPTTALSRLFQGGLPVITSCVNSIYLKTNDGTTKTLYFGRSDGNTFDSITVTSEWQQFVAPASGSNNGQMQFGLSGASSGIPVTTSTIADILAWGADLRPTNDGVGIPAYQRVGAAVTGTSGTISPPVAAVTGVPDYDTSGFPLYLKFDGTDDNLSTGSINPGSVDKAQVFAGLRKLSDAPQLIAETSADSFSNNGTIGVYNYTDKKVYVSSRGTAYAETSTAALTAPITRVLTLQGDISAPSVKLNDNAVAKTTVSTSQGTGNFGNYPLYIGRRGGTSLPFDGRLYSLIVRFGALSNSTQIENAENYINSKTKAY